jgi:hypothetical protein
MGSALSLKEALPIALSAVALIVAVASFVANYRLAKRVAQRPGRLHGVWLLPREPGDGGGFNLILSNGPAALTIAELFLEVKYRMPRRSFFSSDRVTFTVSPSDFHLLGITGPPLPCRLEAHDQASWHLPSTNGLNDGSLVEYRWHGQTALRDKFTSRSLRLGLVDGVNWFGTSELVGEPLSTYYETLKDQYPPAAALLSRQRAGSLQPPTTSNLS